MENAQPNPLSGYFRQPAIYLTLPSQGQWWPESALDLPANGEIPVYPMTARDEIVIRTPDALLNGQGVVDIIQSCCPNIKDAWRIPSIDLDAILISIRIASYGNRMNFESRCPECNEPNNYEVDLGQVLGSMNTPSFDDVIPYRNLQIKLKPQQFEHTNRANMIAYEEQKMLEALTNNNLEPEEKSNLIKASMERIIDIGITACAYSTEHIELQDGQHVTNLDHIKEFYTNAETEVIRNIQDRIKELNETARIRPMAMHCEECARDYQADLNFDYSNFFAKGF